MSDENLLSGLEGVAEQTEKQTDRQTYGRFYVQIPLSDFVLKLVCSKNYKGYMKL